MNVVVLDAIEDYKQQIEKSKTNIQLSYQVKSKEGEKEERTNATEIFVYMDKNRITQVLYNLLDNAIKFTPDGTVAVSEK